MLQALREYVATRRLRPGDRLPNEIQMAQELGVSRAAVREALKALQVAGVISRKPRVGTVLRSLDLSEAIQALSLPMAPSPEEMEEICAARHFLEIALLPLVAQNARERDYRRMEAAIRRQRADLAAGGDGIEADNAFHRALLQAIGNRHLAALAQLVRRYFAFCRQHMQAEGRLPRKPPTYVEEHQEIVNALRRGDVATAQAIMDVHLGRVRLQLASVPSSGKQTREDRKTALPSRFVRLKK